MSLVRRKPAPVATEGPTWATRGTAKHARSDASPADATDRAPTVAATPGSHRASTQPAAPTGPATDQAWTS